MSLDSLFQHILLTEQQLTQQTKRIREAQSAIIRCNEKIKSSTEMYEKAKEEVKKKSQQVSVMKLQCDLMKKGEDRLLKQMEELLCEKNHLTEHLAKIMRESKEKEEKFLQEIFSFNSDFSLRASVETVLENQTHPEMLNLEKEVELLHKEMELTIQRNSHMTAVLQQKRTLQLDLQGLDNISRELDQQLSDAEAVTDCLRAESQFVSQKHLTDPTCVRLRKELEMYKEDELELLRQTLGSEITFLQSKLDSSRQ
ncbi:coiled-coil domain-containing protein 172 [Thalassophryne amazonica]|uniref:coiled-coil domain-containing protein 172 n=1 Tax=Thalassophryne amazonica TaxID=390379 RepID=UPI0014715169|nr:coiled-coil domain-containing protein 172 [Thalassophryne amazonica]